MLIQPFSAQVDHKCSVLFEQWPFYSVLSRKTKRGSTTSPRNVSRFELKQSFPLAPLLEQHRIVAEIETQFTRLDAGVTALKRAQAKLRRYKAAVLKAACEGRLVPTEAELARAEGREYEPADVLARAHPGRASGQWEEEIRKQIQGA